MKIIAISDGGRMGLEDYLRTAKLMGAARVLAKPFSTEVILAAVNELLGDGGALARPPVLT